MIRRTIREWERIGYGSGNADIPEAEADRLAEIARASAFSGRGGEGVLEHGRKGLRARGVVGVIAAPGCQLEILPKIEGGGETNVSDATLRTRLIHMLAVTYDLPIEAGAMTHLGWQRDTVLELLIRLFCAKLIDAVRQGIALIIDTKWTVINIPAIIPVVRIEWSPLSIGYVSTRCTHCDP